MALVAGMVLVLQYLLKGGGYLKLAALFLLRKLWIPLIFFGSIVPGILGTYSYLQGESVEWFLAAPASLGIEFGGQVPTLLNSFQYLNDPSAPILPLIVAALLGVLDLYWAWYLWSRAVTFVDSDISPLLVYGIFIGGFVFCLVFALAVDMYVLPAENLRVSGLTYFLENPGQAVDPLSQFVSEKAAEDSVLNQSINNTTTGR